MHAGQVLYKLSGIPCPVCVPLFLLLFLLEAQQSQGRCCALTLRLPCCPSAFKSHQMLRAQGCWNAGTRWCKAQCPQVTGLGTSSKSYSLSSDFPFSGKSRFLEFVSLFWAPEQDLKYVPNFAFFFSLQEGDYTIAGLGSGILAKWSFGFSQVCCLLQLDWLTLLQMTGFLFLCFQVLLQTPHFSRLQPVWVTPAFGVKQLVHRDRIWFCFKGF